MIIKRTLEETLALMEVAQGKRPAQAYISGGKVVDVYSGEIREANIAVSGARIAYVGGSEAMVGPETRVIDGRGYYLAPGYIDPHFHPDTYCNPHTTAMFILTRGTTAIFSNSSYLPRIFTTEDFQRFIGEVASLPVKIFCGVPEQKYYFPQQEAGYTWEEWERLLSNEAVFGFNEVGMWTRLLNREEFLLRKLLLAKEKGKRVDGHTSGCSYEKLNAVAAAGITSCHEGLSAQEVLDRLRLGFYVMLRHSSSRRDLDKLLPLITQQRIATSRLMFTCDGLTPPDLAERGHLDYLIRRAISHGVKSVTAYQMASLNAATYHGLDHDLGGIGPGRLADINFLTDLGEPTPEMVMANGVLAAKGGDLLIEFPPPLYYNYAHNRHAEPARINRAAAEMFLVLGQGAEVLFPVMHLVNPVINRRVDQSLKVQDGYILGDPSRDLMKVAMVDRQQGRVTTSFMSGFGARIGAMATTENAAYRLLVVGDSEEDMALAINRVLEMKGGVVIADGGKVVHGLALPLGGLMSLEPVTAVAAKVTAMNECLKRKGLKIGDHYYFFSFLPSTFFPDLRVTTEGLFDVKEGRVLIPPREVA